MTALISLVVEACSAAPRMIQARPEVSLLVLELFSGGEESREESREEFGEGVRSVCSRLRLWRGRWIVIARFWGFLVIEVPGGASE